MRGAVDISLALGTLGAAVVVSADPSDSVAERAICTSVEVVVGMRDHTTGEGPLTVGWAHGDFSDAEIEEWLENSGSWDQGDQIGQEVARRKIGILGKFSGDLDFDVLNDGKAIKVKTKKSILIAGDTISFWCFNEDVGALTTGTNITFTGHVNLFAL